MKKDSNSSDECADVVCARHSFLGRSISGVSAIFCKECGKWIKAEASNHIRKREQTRERVRKFRASKCNATTYQQNQQLADTGLAVKDQNS
jgi:hypothetical protein